MTDRPFDGALLEAKGLTKRFGTFTAVDGVDLSIRRGEIFGLLGPNGAGKTTTISMCIGLLRPSEGTVRVAGHDIATETRDAKRLIGYVPDEPYIYEKLTGREFVRFMGEIYGTGEGLRERTAQLLDYFGLTEVADSLVGGYSHGMKQKVGLCAMLVHDPLLIVLDEPTVGLDPIGARLLKDTLQTLAQQGKAIVLCTHIMEIAQEVCDRVAILDRGHIVAEGSIAELRGRVLDVESATLEDIFLQLTRDDESDLLQAVVP
jgi:ABC-2 type transport system ATP-binding protein